MYRCLCPGAIGVSAGLEEGLRLAKLGGYQGLEVGISEVADRMDRDGKDAVLAMFHDAGITPGGFGLPVDWRSDDAAKREADLKALDRLAAAGEALGCVRTSTWIMPASNTLTKEENSALHIERFTPIARVLADHGCSLGLEFIGPATMRKDMKYPFIWDMLEMVELGERIGPNVGLLLDCWHWYTAENTAQQLRHLPKETIVYVHVNDAPAGVLVDEQVDNVRCLPGETGVIDIAAFLGALEHIGYDGPVTPEPFSAKLKGIPAEEAVKMTGAAMANIWRTAGLSE